MKEDGMGHYVSRPGCTKIEESIEGLFPGEEKEAKELAGHRFLERVFLSTIEWWYRWPVKPRSEKVLEYFVLNVEGHSTW